MTDSIRRTGELGGESPLVQVDDDGTEISMRALYRAGVPMLFLRVLQWNEDGRRNSARELVARQLRELPGGADHTDLVMQIREKGGHFATNLLDDDLEEAFYRADGDNTYILSSLYDEWEVDVAMNREKPPSSFVHKKYLHHNWFPPFRERLGEQEDE